MKKKAKRTGKKEEPRRANLAAIDDTKNEHTYYVSDVAQMLGLSPRTVRYYVKQGWLKPVQYNGVRLQFTSKSLKDLRKVMEERMGNERERRSKAMKEIRANQMAVA